MATSAGVGKKYPWKKGPTQMARSNIGSPRRKNVTDVDEELRIVPSGNLQVYVFGFWPSRAFPCRR